MPSPIEKRLDDFRHQGRVQAGSLIISAFGDAILPRGSRIWLGSLIRLLQPLNLNERLVRTAVFRLAREEWLGAEPSGRRADYLLTPSGQRRMEEASRQIYSAGAPCWDHRWRLIVAVGELSPKEREALRRALFWQGFGMLGGHCFVHPGADPGAAFDALVAEGLSGLLGRLKPLHASGARFDAGASDDDLVRSAWNLEKLAGMYGGFLECYGPILEWLEAGMPAEVDGESAFLLRLLLIHDYRRLLLRDPELPEVLLPGDWPGQRARRLCKTLYRRLLGPSEGYLDRHFQLASGETPSAQPMLFERFREEDPLPA